MQVVPISNKMVTGNASAADGGERCFVHLGQLVRAWIRAWVLERVRRQLRRWSQCGCGCGLVAVVHAWAVSCAGERGTSTSCERVAERERELEAQVRLVVTRAGPASIAARNVRAVVGGVRALWWVLVRVVWRCVRWSQCGNTGIALCFVDFFRLFSQKLKISFFSLIKRHTVTYV